MMMTQIFWKCSRISKRTRSA